MPEPNTPSRTSYSCAAGTTSATTSSRSRPERASTSRLRCLRRPTSITRTRICRIFRAHIGSRSRSTSKRPALEAVNLRRGASRLAAPLAHWGPGRLGLGLVAFALAALAGGAFAREFPVASTGDIWFQADHAGFQDPDGKVIEEYYFRVVNNQSSFEPYDGDSTYRGRLFVSLEFKDKDGNGVAKAGHDFSFMVVGEKLAESPDDAQVLVIREPLHPRAASVQIKVEDMKARKRGLLYLVTGKRKNGEAEAALPPPPFVGKTFGLSDLQFAWEVLQNLRKGSFQKNGLEVIPNPQRSYGLLQPRLTAYYEIYDRRENRPDSTTYV